MTKAASPPSNKQARIIERALKELAREKSYKQINSLEDFGDNSFRRELQLPGHRLAQLSDHGMEQVERLADMAVNAAPFAGLVDFSDVWTASWETLEQKVSSGTLPDSAHEWIDLISARITPLIKSRVIIFPFIGVRLKDIDEFVLGSCKLVRPSISLLDTKGVDHDWADVPKIIDDYRSDELWLYGHACGTQAVAERCFRTLADLFAGLLAVMVAVLSKTGANRVFISSNMRGHDSHGLGTWFSWVAEGTAFTIHQSGLRGLPFDIDKGLCEQLYQASEFQTAIRIIEREARTRLEESIARGFHWFADAHRDPTLVMQFVKYWSCIETFFSMDQEAITRSVSIGDSGVLAFGGFGFVPHDDYAKTKKRIAHLYALRSKAVHRASRSHVTETDVAELSRYAAQLLFNMVSFVERGYQKPEEIKQHCERMDAAMERGQNSGSAD